LRHRQTKGAATDMFYLTPPRHISTLPNSEVGTRNCEVRFTPNTGHCRRDQPCPKSATTRLMHRSKQHLYSIASLARASNVCGTQRPSALAVVRLIRSSMRVSGKCRSTSLRRLLGQTSLKGHSFFNLTISVSLPLTPTEC
jgi:hypothetical protein